MASLFRVEDRDRVRVRVLELAAADERVVAGAVVGSLALTDGDRWSDLDLTFGVADGVPVEAVLADWTRTLVDELDAVHLFDLPSGGAIYRVFLMPGCLQVDLSFAPAAVWGAGGPKFRLLFGEAGERPFAEPPDADELLGYAVHHALRARFSLERGGVWLAAYWVGELRNYGLSLACVRRQLPARYGRGFDDLPADVLHSFEGAFVRSLEPDELRRALRSAVDALLREAGERGARVEQLLRILAAT